MTCTRCKKREVQPGRTHCPSCIEYKKFWSQGRYDIRVANGKCAMCGINKVDKLVHCHPCRMKRSRQYTARKEASI